MRGDGRGAGRAVRDDRTRGLRRRDAEPRPACEVARYPPDNADRRVAVASYLLAGGHFHRRAQRCGADRPRTEPLLDPGEPDPRWVDLVLDRFAEATAPDPAHASVNPTDRDAGSACTSSTVTSSPSGSAAAR